jgi:outer membrane lipoprotein carrier protein
MLPALMMCLSLLAQTSAPPLTADAVVKKVQTYYASTQKLRAKFRQEYTNTTFGRTSTSDGLLRIAKPGRMRWDYDKPETKYFISDGTVLWVYEPESKQAIEQQLKDQILPVAVTFLYGKGDLAAEFSAALAPGKYGDKDDLCVELTPKKPEAQYKKLWLVVDPGDFHVKQSIILEASDNLNHFTFFDITLNAKAENILDKTFKFTPPAGVKVVKPEQAGGAPTNE